MNMRALKTISVIVLVRQESRITEELAKNATHAEA